MTGQSPGENTPRGQAIQGETRRRAPLCPSGTFADTVLNASAFNDPQLTLNVLISTIYTCADGSGTITMRKHVFLQFNPDFSSTNTGPLQILGGTGAFAGLIGHGVDLGESNGTTSASGQITGWVLQR